MYRSHSCGELRASHINTEITLAGWVQKTRDKGFMIWVDLRDRYGVTQLIFDEERTPKEMMEKAKSLGREFVIQVTGTVIDRESKNSKMPTGAIEVLVSKLEILNASITPPFTIEDKTDGGEDIRMKYRYLDIRRNPVKESLIFRHKVSMEVRKYLSDQEFIEVETPYLIKSTPEGARDFVVPSRMNEGQFYALPQSPQTFKQLLMVGGMDKYFQIVKCFRDEDLRADRQPEFTQIDCEMAFVEQEDILNIFEGLTRHLLKEVNNVEVEKFPRMLYDDAMRLYGNEIGGGSIRIHDKQMQATMLRHLGFSDEDAKAQFGFLMDAFEYGAPPHGGLAFGLDRLVAILGGQETIRDFIAFPKNNSGRDVMIDAPAFIDDTQLKELSLKLDIQE